MSGSAHTPLFVISGNGNDDKMCDHRFVTALCLARRCRSNKKKRPLFRWEPFSVSCMFLSVWISTSTETTEFDYSLFLAGLQQNKNSSGWYLTPRIGQFLDTASHPHSLTHTHTPDILTLMLNVYTLRYIPYVQPSFLCSKRVENSQASLRQ